MSNESEMKDACEICQAPMPHSPRYASRLCEACAGSATDESGRGLDFYNEDAGGGLLALFKDSGERAPGGSGTGMDCWVHGVACVAQEARFGGVVVSRKRGGG